MTRRALFALLLAGLVAWVTPVEAALSPAQLVVLRAHIDASPDLSSIPNTPDGAFEVAVLLNRPADPAFIVWKTSVSVVEMMQNGFDWTRVDNLTVGKARIWEFMTAAGTLNPSRPNVRAGFEATFSVEAGDQSTRQAIYDHSSRPATRAEKLYATGTGAPPTHHGVGPATLGWEGLVTFQDVQSARNLP